MPRPCQNDIVCDCTVLLSYFLIAFLSAGITMAEFGIMHTALSSLWNNTLSENVALTTPSSFGWKLAPNMRTYVEIFHPKMSVYCDEAVSICNFIY